MFDERSRWFGRGGSKVMKGDRGLSDGEQHNSAAQVPPTPPTQEPAWQ